MTLSFLMSGDPKRGAGALLRISPKNGRTCGSGGTTANQQLQATLSRCTQRASRSFVIETTPGGEWYQSEIQRSHAP